MLRRLNLLCVIAAVVVASQLVVEQKSASAVTVVSSPFSIGYGFVRTGTNVGVWNTSETSGANTATTIGDFSFTPTVSGGLFSNAGLTFPGRVITAGAGSDDGIGTTVDFGLSITGAYTGAIPADTILSEIKLNITNLRVRGLAVTVLPGNTMTWNETTVGLLQSNTATTLTSVAASSAAYETPSNWTAANWNPADLTITGLTQTRTFNILASNGRGLDGLEIFGTVEATFTLAVPEPSSGLLLGLGTLAFARRIARRNKFAAANA